MILSEKIPHPDRWYKVKNKSLKASLFHSFVWVPFLFENRFCSCILFNWGKRSVDALVILPGSLRWRVGARSAPKRIRRLQKASKKISKKALTKSSPKWSSGKWSKRKSLFQKEEEQSPGLVSSSCWTIKIICGLIFLLQLSGHLSESLNGVNGVTYPK